MKSLALSLYPFHQARGLAAGWPFQGVLLEFLEPRLLMSAGAMLEPLPGLILQVSPDFASVVVAQLGDVILVDPSEFAPVVAPPVEIPAPPPPPDLGPIENPWIPPIAPDPQSPDVPAPPPGLEPVDDSWRIPPPPSDPVVIEDPGILPVPTPTDPGEIPIIPFEPIAQPDRPTGLGGDSPEDNSEPAPLAPAADAWLGTAFLAAEAEWALSAAVPPTAVFDSGAAPGGAPEVLLSTVTLGALDDDGVADLAAPAAGESLTGDGMSGEMLYLTADGVERALEVLADNTVAEGDSGPLAADGRFAVPAYLLPEGLYLRVE